MTKGEQLKKIKNNKSEKEYYKKECSKLWSKIVKIKADYKCEFPSCKKSGKYYKLDAHHFFTKGGHPHLRYDLDNGICLCFEHHRGGKCGAHQDPLWKDKFLGRIENYKPSRSEEWFQKLIIKSQYKQKIDIKMEYLYLQKEYEKIKSRDLQRNN